MIKLGQIVLKGVIWVHYNKMMSNGLERGHFGYTMIKLIQIVLKELSWVDNTKIRSNGLERSQ